VAKESQHRMPSAANRGEVAVEQKNAAASCLVKLYRDRIERLASSSPALLVQHDDSRVITQPTVYSDDYRNTLEIEKQGERAIKFHIFTLSHDPCEISGEAWSSMDRKRDFVFHSYRCTLHLLASEKEDSIKSFVSDGGCREFCGLSGTINGLTFRKEPQQHIAIAVEPSETFYRSLRPPTSMGELLGNVKFVLEHGMLLQEEMYSQKALEHLFGAVNVQWEHSRANYKSGMMRNFTFSVNHGDALRVHFSWMMQDANEKLDAQGKPKGDIIINAGGQFPIHAKAYNNCSDLYSRQWTIGKSNTK
jgi:hypothetical protein